MIFFLFLFFIFGGLSAASDASTQTQCLDTVDFSSTWIRKWTPCPQQVQLEKRTVTNVSSAFDITFQCYHAPNSVCEKAKRSFEKAAKMISDIVLFKEPVRVNATLMSFCQMGADCNNGMMTLGGSSPTRSIPLINTDGLSRLHPQALVKQFDLSEHPSYFPFDIISVFNADAPFWFEEDDVAIKSNQADFAFVILHEFMHGLGFFSGWNQYLSTGAVTPDPSPLLANQFIMLVNPISNALHTNQFVESAMDRLIHILVYDENNAIAETRSLSTITKQLNHIQANNVTELLNSPEFYPALEMNNISTEPYSLGVILSSEEEDDIIVLETGLKPFQPGSSISHVAYEGYTHTPDFLMRYMQDRGMTLDDAVKRGGGKGPIGPMLLRILEEIGYSTIKNPNNIPPLITNNALVMVPDTKRKIARPQTTQMHIESKSSRIQVSYFLKLSLLIFIICIVC